MIAQPEARNPYRPGAAVQPVFLAGRESQIARFGATLRSAPELPANVRITGLRGVGKTVLLKRLEEAAQDEQWVPARVQVEPRHNSELELSALIEQMCDAAAQQVSRMKRLQASVRSAVTVARGLVKLSWHDIELSMAGQGMSEERPLAKELYEVARAADERGFAGFLLMLDEAQVIRDDRARDGEHPLSLLIAAVNTLQEAQVPVGLVLCGLPTLRTNLLRARTYTERMFRGEEVSNLDDPEALEAFVKPLEGTGISADPDLVDQVVREVEGYPYFVQLWGAELWEAARTAAASTFSARLLKVIEPDIYRRLDLDFYDPRVESLTPAEQDLLMETVDCSYPPLRTSEIQGKSGKRQGNVNVLMGRLVEQGVLFRIQKGQYEYTAPKFHDYLLRRSDRLTRARR